MDSVVRWFMAVALSLVGAVWFMNKIEDELQQNKKENEDFFIRKEIEEKYKKTLTL